MTRSKFQLNPCASFLYHWILIHEKKNKTFNLDSQAFQIWTTEFLNKPISKQEINEAIAILQNLNLIIVEEEQIRINDQENKNAIDIQKLPGHTLSIPKIKRQGIEVSKFLLLLSLICLWGGSLCLLLSTTRSSNSLSNPASITPWSVLK